MILDCDACLVRLQDRPRYCRSKVGLTEVNGVAYVVMINSKTREKLKIENIIKLYNSTISFRNPNVNLVLKNADPVMLNLMFIHLKKLIKGEKTNKLPEFEMIKNKKPRGTTFHQIGNDFNMNLFENSNLNKLTIEKVTQILPKQIWNFNYLTELNLIECNLETLPKKLCHFAKTLKLLNLSSNKLIKIDKLFFPKMWNLVSLNLSNNQIKFIPLDIVLCRNLVKIDLSKNLLTNLPYTLIYLKKLIELNINSNQIKFFSSAVWFSFSTKLNLIKLDISNNHSTEVVNNKLIENGKYLNFKIPTLKQFSINSVTRKPQLFCNLRIFVPLFINDEIEEQTDLCSYCKKPYSAEKFFENIQIHPICDLGKGSILNEEQVIFLCKNLCPTCKFNQKFRRQRLLSNDYL